MYRNNRYRTHCCGVSVLLSGICFCGESLAIFCKPHTVLIKVMRFCHVKSMLVPENPFGRCSP